MTDNELPRFNIEDVIDPDFDHGETHEEREFREAHEATVLQEALDMSNMERIQALVSANVMLPPGLFEMQRTIVYLETLLTHSGLIQSAQLQYAERVRTILDGLEGQVTRAKLLQPQGPVPNGRTPPPPFQRPRQQ
jgi:hypothetical protein